MQISRQGQKAAGCHIGILSAYGLEVKKSPQEPLKYYRNASEDAYPLAQILLGISYLTGIKEVIGIDIEQAYVLFKKAGVISERYRNWNYCELIELNK